MNIPQYLHTRLGKQGLTQQSSILIDGRDETITFNETDSALTISDSIKEDFMEAVRVYKTYGISVLLGIAIQKTTNGITKTIGTGVYSIIGYDKYNDGEETIYLQVGERPVTYTIAEPQEEL